MKKTILNTLILLLISNYSFSQSNLDKGLVAHFPLDENTIDASFIKIDGKENDITYNQGIINQAAYFDGLTSYIYCGSDNRTINMYITVSAWIKTSTTTPDVVVGKYNWVDDRGILLSISGLGGIVMHGRNNAEAYASSSSSYTQVTDNQWHHIVGIVNNDTWEIWLDGVKENSAITPVSWPYLANTEPLTIGKSNLFLNSIDNFSYYSGLIDDVRIYNRVLNENEISELYNSASTKIMTSMNDSYKIYPNPSKEYIIIETETDDFNYTIYDISGKIVLKGNNNKKIDIQNFVHGVYTIKIKDNIDNKLLTKKIIIK